MEYWKCKKQAYRTSATQVNGYGLVWFVSQTNREGIKKLAGSAQDPASKNETLLVNRTPGSVKAPNINFPSHP